MYDFMKLLHIIGSILFLGNIIVSALWAMRSDRTGNPAVMLEARKLVIVTDKIFTIPGSTLLLIAGYGASGIGKISLMTPWLLVSQLLFFASFFIWMFILNGTQKKLVELAEVGVSTGTMPDEYRKQAKRWAMFGGMATLLPCIALVLMVLKP